MKITCQACQSKYTIADDKIQGKVAKIRCRKCGATVLVDASTGASRNGSGAPPASNEVWLVSVAEGDQRPMQLQEVIDAYNSGVIVGDTYLWKEGLGDWQPLSEIAEIVNALNEANAAAAMQEDYQAAAPVEYAPPAAYSQPAAYTPSPAVAARRETSRGRGDLFGGGVAVEEEVATSAPVQARAGGAGAMLGGMSSSTTAQQRSAGSGLTGARDEQSVLFSLSALTSNAKAPSAPPVAMTASAPSTTSRNEDSGLIDLNALAKAQQASKAAEEAAAPLAAPTPFLFPAALGTVETFQPAAEPKKSSSKFMIIGGGLAVAGIAIAIALLAMGKKEEVAPLSTTPSASVAAEPAPPPAPVADPAPADSASAVASAKPAAVKKAGGGGGVRAVKAPGGAAPGPATPLPAPAPKPRSPCGCAASDLQCQIRCSAVGK
jgi:predicted Zn finger-like uncharacterized protein